MQAELSSITERVEALRESEVTWIVKELGDSRKQGAIDDLSEYEALPELQKTSGMLHV